MAEKEKSTEAVSDIATEIPAMAGESFPEDEKLRKKEEKEAKKRRKRLRKKRKWPIFLIIAALIAGGYFAYKKMSGNKEVGPKVNTAKAAYGNVIKTIEGEGTIAPEQYQATSLVKGEIVACYIEEGDYVEKDQILYEIDSGDVENSIARAQNTLKSAQNNYNTVLDNMKDLNITAPIGGTIQKMHVKNGDQVNMGSPIADIVDQSVMKLKINFISAQAANLYIGQNASVMMISSSETLNGTISKISTGALVNGDGVAVATVEIQVVNPGAIVPGDKATAMAGGFACTDAGVFEYNGSETVTAKQSGKIRNLAYNDSDKVYSGALIATIENTTFESNLEAAEIAVDNARLSLDDMNKSLDNYKIKSQISGKVIQKNSKLGDKIDISTAQTVMAIISDPTEISFSISVDELDIASIKVDMPVTITADALEGKVFTGRVDNVSEVGTSMNGVTTYPVKIVVDNGENSGLISGMNVDAIITVASKENVLTVPASAVQRGNIVYVKKGTNNGAEKVESKAPEKPEGGMPGGAPGGGMSGGAPGGGMPGGGMPAGDMKNNADKGKNAGGAQVPEGFEAITVEIGLSNENTVEIISGLSEGAEVIVQDEARGGDLMSMMMGMHGSATGGGGPAGGPPSGGGGAPMR